MTSPGDVGQSGSPQCNLAFSAGLVYSHPIPLVQNLGGTCEEGHKLTRAQVLRKQDDKKILTLPEEKWLGKLGLYLEEEQA